MNKKQDIQNQIEKLKEEIKTLEGVVEFLDKKGSEKNWRAKEGAGYWSLAYNGNAFCPAEEGDYADDYHYNSLRYFKTKEEAEDYKKYSLAVGKVTRAIWKANGDWRPDFNDLTEEKYYIYNIQRYETEYFGIDFDFNSNRFRAGVLPYIKDRHTAGQIIEDYEPELKIIFDYQRNVIK